MKKLLQNTISFLILFLYTSLYLLGLFLFGWVFDSFGEEYAFYGVWIYLLISLIYVLFRKYKKHLTKEKIYTTGQVLKNLVKNMLRLAKYLILAVIVITLLFLVGGWIAGLSATSVIIILLFLILIKNN